MTCNTDTNHLLATLSEKSRRQVELTVNAICRANRKALRQAEVLDKLSLTEEVPAELREQAWQEARGRGRCPASRS